MLISMPGRILLLLCFLTSGCCQLSSIKDKQPERPKVTSSWTERTDFFGVTSIGFFVMNKGESIDNGKLGIRVIDIIPAQCPCVMCESTFPATKISFYRPSDGKILCEGEFHRGTADLAVMAKCNPTIGVTHIAINAINTKENWVSFDLRK